MRTVPLLIGLWLAASTAQAQISSYLGRPITLGRGEGRLDVAPPDWGYMAHGALNNRRGLILSIPDRGETSVWLGAGGAYGVTDQLEVGGLLLPLRISPSGDLGDLEGYVRYALTPGGDFALQGTVQIPTDTDLGLGFGVPVLVSLGGANRLETGVELEMIFYDDTVTNLDVPAAFQFSLGHNAYAGPRTGLIVADLEDLVINLGAQAGIVLHPAIEVSGSINWPRFLWTGPGDAINIDTIDVLFGTTVHL